MKQQTVLIIGYGEIGRRTASLIAATGAKVIGVRRTPDGRHDYPVYSMDALPDLLPVADHVILILPGNPSTDRFMNPERLAQCKAGAFLYNFGRGNSLLSADLLDSWDHLGGAFLDVTDEEPLPADSPLWKLGDIMITPHSSCIFDDYRKMFIDEVGTRLKQELQ